ncbi:phosphatidylinositol 4-kinase (nucleomorph) [Guillardia theta]|uniref:Phosphatidylinositol 4-kinase n=1 Tax=Guillardia theta TaxID=55529 RepID=Q98RM0_GUITH|nr:phosphatidylinositol 4-kinase [Guillardia theta]AAK39928.1 phosphatidylinositol 4-kinase [Guillardia theta]
MVILKSKLLNKKKIIKNKINHVILHYNFKKLYFIVIFVNIFNTSKIIIFFCSKIFRKKNYKFIYNRLKVLKVRNEINIFNGKFFFKKKRKQSKKNYVSCFNFLKLFNFLDYNLSINSDNCVNVIFDRNKKKQKKIKIKTNINLFKCSISFSSCFTFIKLSSQITNSNRLKITYELVKKNITYKLKKISFYIENLNFVKNNVLNKKDTVNYNKNFFMWLPIFMRCYFKKLKFLTIFLLSKIYILPSKTKIPLKISLQELKKCQQSTLINSEFIIKNASDMHFEIIATIIFTESEKITREMFLDIWLNPYLCFKVNKTIGIIEIVSNSKTIHEIKNDQNCINSFYNNFIELYYSLEKRNNFYESMSGYSLLCYLLQIKDRHNCNILLGSDNRLIHLDYGFILDEQPGNMSFEPNSFKFTKYFMYKIGGKKSEDYEKLRYTFIRAFISIRKYTGNFISIIYTLIFESFQGKNIRHKIIKLLKRLCLTMSDKLLIKTVINLFDDSYDNWKTIQYDKYQKYVSGII